MTVRRCVPWPSAVLRTPAADVAAITDEVRAIWADMIDTMDAMPGYGLAAVQIGVPLRLAVVDCSEARGQAVRMANPEILHASGQMREHDEASPNLPGVSAVISRPRAVTVPTAPMNGYSVPTIRAKENWPPKNAATAPTNTADRNRTPPDSSTRDANPNNIATAVVYTSLSSKAL